ncbi:hypothetical protein C0J52_08681 [Blattella germanica]|nr:hypothetical protein C0J52_08681 [Blattella germanica]
MIMDITILTLMVITIGFPNGEGQEVKDLMIPKFETSMDGCKPILNNFMENRNNVKCKPHDVIIPINTGEVGYIYEPTHVSVKKCSGTCKDNTSCVKDETKITKISVRKLHPDSGGSECGLVEVEEDVSCQCSCTVTENDCNENQMYLPDYCMCKCMKDKDMTEECEKSQRLWDPARCDCFCKDEDTAKQRCSSMQYFNRMKCKCMDQHDN